MPLVPPTKLDQLSLKLDQPSLSLCFSRAPSRRLSHGALAEVAAVSLGARPSTAAAGQLSQEQCLGRGAHWRPACGSPDGVASVQWWPGHGSPSGVAAGVRTWSGSGSARTRQGYSRQAAIHCSTIVFLHSSGGGSSRWASCAGPRQSRAMRSVALHFVCLGSACARQPESSMHTASFFVFPFFLLKKWRGGRRGRGRGGGLREDPKPVLGR